MVVRVVLQIGFAVLLVLELFLLLAVGAGEGTEPLQSAPTHVEKMNR